MIKRKRIGIDADDVFIDFIGGFVEVACNVLNRQITPQDLPQWDIFGCFPEDERKILLEECERPGFCMNLRPLPGAVDAIKELKKYADVYIVTAPFHSHTWVFERNWWIKQVLEIPKGDVVHTSAKFLVEVDAFLDDKIDNVVEWHKHHPNGLPMLWPAYHSLHKEGLDNYRVKDWDDVIQRVVDHKVGG